MSDAVWPIVSSGTVLLAVLLAIAVIDARSQMIPNELNLALAATGIASQWLIAGSFPLVPILTGVGMFGLFWLVRTLHSRARGRVGLGFGDIKMAGAGAVWIAPPALPSFLLIASAAGLVYVLAKSLWARKLQFELRTPFGPFLALGLFVAWSAEQFSTFSG